MTTERRPPDKVQCLRSGAIFPRIKMEMIEDREYTTNVCPVCDYRTPGAYVPCRTFQDVGVDVT